MALLDVIRPYILERKKLKYSGVEYEYLVVSSEFGINNDAPEMFAIFKSGVLAISDACPEEYRELWIIHELMELSNPPVPETGCVESLIRELEMAQEKYVDMNVYVQSRLKFFQGLVTYYSGKEPGEGEEALLKRLKLSLDYLIGYEPIT